MPLLPEISGALDMAAELLPEVIQCRVGPQRSWTAKEVERRVWLCQLGWPPMKEMPAVYVLLCQRCDGAWLMPWLQPLGVYPVEHDGCGAPFDRCVQGWVRVRARGEWVGLVRDLVAPVGGGVPDRPAVRGSNRADEFWVEAWFPPSARAVLEKHPRVRALAVELEPRPFTGEGP